MNRNSKNYESQGFLPLLLKSCKKLAELKIFIIFSDFSRNRLFLDSLRFLWYTGHILSKEGAEMRWLQNSLILHFLGCDRAADGISAPFFR